MIAFNYDTSDCSSNQPVEGYPVVLMFPQGYVQLANGATLYIQGCQMQEATIDEALEFFAFEAWLARRTNIERERHLRRYAKQGHGPWARLNSGVSRGWKAWWWP